MTQQLFYVASYDQLNASRNKYSYHISLAQNSIQLFTIFNALSDLFTSAQKRFPEFFAFSDLDLISKIPVDINDRDLYDISAQLCKTKSFGIIRTFDEVRVYAQEEDQRINESSENRETFELGLIMN